MSKTAFIYRLTAALLLAVFSMLSMPGHASCAVINANQVQNDNASAQIAFGRVNLTSTYLQPVGTLLASTVIPPTAYTYGGANAATVLWTCDRDDLDKVYFLVATNGDDRVGGHWETGASDGLPGVYATWFAYVGLKLTMSSVTVSRYWQRIPLGTYEESGGKIHIRLQDVPTMQAELYRISSMPALNVGNNCWSLLDFGYASASGTTYNCTEPNAYIQLAGPGLTHDEAGDDSDTKYLFWWGKNGFSYRMYQGTSLSNTATCVARNVTPNVQFPTISAQQFQSGESVQANFSVQVECESGAISGTASGQTALGIQVSSGAYQAAQSLGLVNASGGVTALVSDNYGNDSSLAQGVGITLKNASTGATMMFVGQPGNIGAVPGGPEVGWYPVLEEGDTMINGYKQVSRTFTATLKQLPSRTVTPGKVYATAYVLVKVQ